LKAFHTLVHVQRQIERVRDENNGSGSLAG
jgi:hypothetical protein